MERGESEAMKGRGGWAEEEKRKGRREEREKMVKQRDRGSSKKEDAEAASEMGRERKNATNH